MESEYSGKLLTIIIQHHIPHNATTQVAVATRLMRALKLGPCVTSMLQLPNYMHPAQYQLFTSSRFRVKTPQEIVLEGLLGKSKLLNMEIKTIPEKGRGVFVNESVPAGSFVVEYKTARVYPRSERDRYEAMYTLNAEPCMVLEVQTPQGGA